MILSDSDTSKPLLSRLPRFRPLFWLVVVLPTCLAILYYGLFASDLYISESRFIVRSPDKPAVSGLGLLVKGSGLSTAGDETFTTKDFLTSRDALRAINRDRAFERAFTAPTISQFDRFKGLGTGGTFESLFKYYGKKVKVESESSSSITTLIVRAYDPGVAKHFNEQLIEMAEQTVNRMSERGRADLIDIAQKEVDAAKDKSQSAAVALAQLRNRQGLIDPEKQATIQMQMISKLQDQLITTKTQLLELRTLAPRSEQIPVLEARARGLALEIDNQSSAVAGNTRSLAASAVQYQRVSLENQFADKQLASALASLEAARSEARRKHAYVERVVEPNLPDYPLEPRRFRGVISVFVLGLIAWGVLSMLIAGLMEHRD
jgi:capsular polysaccharide transport system permease protein